MSDRPLVVLTVDGLSRDSIGAMGCPWNQTPAIDAIAATGWTMDRCVVDRDADQPDLTDLFAQEVVGRYRSAGQTILVTDDPSVADSARGNAVGIDEVVLVPQTHSPSIAESLSIEQTSMGQLFNRAIEAESGVDTSLLWIHSRSLREQWDAPESLRPTGWETHPGPDEDEDVIDDGSEPEDVDMDDSAGDAMDWSDPTPPSVTLAGDDPDLAGQWMQRYGAQVRQLDLLIEILLASLTMDDPQIAIVSVGGFSLGQSGSIGYRQGPVRSSQIHVPAIISDLGVWRSDQIASPGEVLRCLIRGGGRSLDGLASARPGDPSRVLRTDSDRAAVVATTEDWMLVVDHEGNEALFVKPDDIHDANNVAQRQIDVVDRLREAAEQTKSRY